jgi:hypothetical protein
VAYKVYKNESYLKSAKKPELQLWVCLLISIIAAIIGALAEQLA